VTLSGKAPKLADIGPAIEASRPLPPEVISQLRAAAESWHLPVEAVAVAFLLHYLHAYTGERELLVGVMGACGTTAKSSADARPLLMSVDPDGTLRALVAEADRQLDRVMSPASGPEGDPGEYGTLIEIDRDAFHSRPERRDPRPTSLPGLAIPDFAVSITSGSGEGGATLSVRASSTHYTPAALDLHAGRLADLLSRRLEALGDVPLARIGILGARERQAVVADWNARRADLTPTPCLHASFEQHARAFPGSVAVASGGQTLTYAALNARANQLARHLRQHGVGPDQTVAICVDRGIDMIVGLLAVLKAGGAYVPLDPTFPRDRLAYMLKDSAPLACIHHAATERALRGLAPSIPRVDLDDPASPWANLSSDDIPHTEVGVGLSNLAYVIYTSGSTGLPKGVAIRGRNLLNYTQFILGELGVPSGTKFASVSTIAADLGNTTVFPSLLGGGELHVIDHHTATNAKLYEAYMRENRIDVLKITPSHFKALFDASSSEVVVPRKALVFGGERLASDFVDAIHALSSGCRVFNHYGPTECTVGSIMHLIERNRDKSADKTADKSADKTADKSANIPLGRPIANTQIYILDGDGQPVPIGKVGEIHIAGAGVSPGYINREEETRKRFKPDPFSPAGGGRMYMTGDLGRWLPDGMIEFMGRNDFQIKLRGFRIELGEIESALARHPKVNEAAVVAIEDGSGKRLCAYYTGPEDLPAQSLRQHLLTTLPDYMVPSQFLRMDAMPLMANGKLDRRALPAPTGPAAERETTLPTNPVEQALVEGWAKIMPSFAPDTSISFVDSGGDSLSHIRVSVVVEKALGWVPPDWDQLTIRELAALKKTSRQSMTSINSTVLIRAISIIFVVLDHLHAVTVPSTTTALMLVSGWSFGRYQISSTYSQESVRPILSTAFKIALPFLLYTLFLQLSLSSFGGASLLMIDNLISPAYNKGLTAWYVELLIQIMVIMAALFSFRRVRRLAHDHQFLFGAAGSMLAFLVAVVSSRVWSAEALFGRVPHLWLWLYFLGIAVAKAPSRKARVLLAIMFVGMYAFDSNFELWLFALVAAPFVILVERVKIPTKLDFVIKQIATASLFIYMTHFQVARAAEKAGVRNRFLASVVAIAGGMALSVAWDYAYGHLVKWAWMLVRRARPHAEMAVSRGDGAI
jgi:amino acid adenylation domain-containing protein